MKLVEHGSQKYIWPLLGRMFVAIGVQSSKVLEASITTVELDADEFEFMRVS